MNIVGEFPVYNASTCLDETIASNFFSLNDKETELVKVYDEQLIKTEYEGLKEIADNNYYSYDDIQTLKIYFSNCKIENNHVTELVLFNKNIKNISGIKNLTKLKKLSLDANKISNIDYLENLIELEDLNLSGNKINEIKSLKNLTNLKYLNLFCNQIENIDDLINLTKLEKLQLKTNQIKNINCLLNLNNLKSVYLLYNQPDKSNKFKFIVYNLIKNGNISKTDINLSQEDVDAFDYIANSPVLDLTLEGINKVLSAYDNSILRNIAEERFAEKYLGENDITGFKEKKTRNEKISYLEIFISDFNAEIFGLLPQTDIDLENGFELKL